MKILHLIYSEQVAGAEKYLLDLLPGFQNEGIECQLICVTPAKDAHKFTALSHTLNEQGVKTILLNGTVKNFLSLAGFINKYLRENNINYLHAHLFKSDLLAVIVKRVFNRNLILLSTKHGYQEKYFKNYQHNKSKIVFDAYYFISRFVNRNIDYQVTISKAMSELYYNLKLTKSHIPFIYHGIDITIPHENPDSKLASPQLTIVGRVEEIKGHTYLLKALPSVIKSFPTIKLLVIGNGTERENLLMEAQSLGIKEHVHFMGFQPNPAKFIAASDIIILPSIFEPFGLVYIEAFALKTPVIAFDVQACNEIIENGKTGLLVPLFDSVAISEKIIYLLNNDEERERIANNAYKKYVEYFKASRMVKDTAAWYRSVIKVQ